MEIKIKSKLKEFFNLEENEEYFRHAITPKSCGGGDEFKLLALLGDRETSNLKKFVLALNKFDHYYPKLATRILGYMRKCCYENKQEKILS